MEKENKRKSKKAILLIIIIIISIGIVTLGISVINNRNAEISKTEDLITNDELISVLNQSGSAEYLEEDSLKLGKSIDFNYDKYNKMISFSYINSNGTILIKRGGLALLNKDTKECKNIELNADISSIIYYLNIENKIDMLEG